MTASLDTFETARDGEAGPEELAELADFDPLAELGKTGFKRAGGYVIDEFLPQLKGRQAIKVFREMSDNDPIVGAMLNSLKRLIAGADWAVEPFSSSAEDRRNAEFVEQCRDDMTETWSSFVIEALSSLEYGWSWHEICYKQRRGPWYENPEDGDLHRSKYDDGRMGWANMPCRSQESWQRWIFDTKGTAVAMVQMPAPDYQMRPIPRGKSLHFRPMPNKGSPEGRSILRNSYRPWYFKKRHEETEAVGVERDLTGLPVAELPARIINAKGDSKEAKTLSAYKKMIKAVRRDENEGLVLPIEYDDKGNPLYKFSLMSSGGSRQFDTNAIITRNEARILMPMLMDFILVGHEGVGSYNMHSDKTGLFKVVCNSILKLMAEEINNQAIPKLFRINGVKPKGLPRFVPGDVDSPDLAQLAAFMQALAGMGVQWFPDPKLENWARTAADMPKLDKETEEVLEIQQHQAQVMQLAQQRLAALQIGQQAMQGEQQLAAGDQSAAQAQLQTQTQQAEFDKPGSTQPPQKALPSGANRPKPSGPPRKAVGRKAGASNKPQPRKAVAR